MYQKPFNKTGANSIFLATEAGSAPLQRLQIFSLKGVQMRTFHLTWLMFFVCFFGWFGLAPLMPTIRADLGLTKAQVGNIVIASVASTVIARLVVGRLCDRWGPRKTAVRLLVIGSIPVFTVGLAHDYLSFLLFRFAIGIIGASFVITQFHTSLMVAPAIKGRANAITGGWGNLGGGVTNMLMPLLFAALVGFGYTPSYAWRYAMILPGVLMLTVAWLYYKYTSDTPSGNFGDPSVCRPPVRAIDWRLFSDYRIWILALSYGACFGMELTFDGVASLHFVDKFGLSQASAGLWAGTFGFMNLFARALGGLFSDKIGKRHGMRGKGLFLAGALLLEGLGLVLFSGAASLPVAIGLMLVFAFFLKMANGATFGMVPFINEQNMGLVSGVVGAGGNLGGVLFGFLFKMGSLSYTQAFFYIGCIVACMGLLVSLTRFGSKVEAESPALSLA